MIAFFIASKIESVSPSTTVRSIRNVPQCSITKISCIFYPKVFLSAPGYICSKLLTTVGHSCERRITTNIKHIFIPYSKHTCLPALMM
jgi:hypothetical protein